MAKRNWDRLKHIHNTNWRQDELERKLYKGKSKKPTKALKLGKHEDHDLQFINSPSGPHSGKVVCNTCCGKFVTWLPKGFKHNT